MSPKNGEDGSFYVAFKVKDMPVPLIDCVKRMCSGGCGDEVWVDKKAESVWSRMSVLCNKCALDLMDSGDGFEVIVAPETIESVRSFLRDRLAAKRKLRVDEGAC